MEKQILNFTVNEQILTCDNPIRISTNKVNYIQANFDLGQNWSGYDSVRAIWFNDFQTISTVLDSQGITSVPFEVMKRKGCVKVNLVGSISEDDVLTDRLTSYPVVAVIVDCTAQITGANTSPITPSEYEQFVAAVHEDAERAEAGATASEQSAQNAHTSEQNASQSATSAHNDKIAIEQAIAEVIQQIEDFEQVQVVVNTLPPSSQATSDFTDGVLTLGIPQGVKGDTGNGIQSIAKVGTSGLVDTYRITYTNGQTTTFTVTNGAKGDTGNGIQSIVKTSTVGLVDTYTITYTDGTTTTFTVTNGEKGDKGDTGEVSLSELEDATVVQTLSDSTPYNYRRTNNGNGSGTREYDEIVGASVGWCQLVDGDNVAKGTYTTYANGVFTISYTSPDTVSRQAIGTIKLGGSGHKILFDYKVKNLREYAPTLNVYVPDGGGAYIYTYFRDTSKATIRQVNGTKVQLYQNDIVSGRTYDIDFEYSIIDLTLFNSQIADYVYTLEQSTAGSGVTWLKTHFPRLFDNGYQPFDSGSIKSVSGLTAHEMVGKNLFDQSAYTSLERATYEDGKFNSTYLAIATGIMVRTYKNGATVNTIVRTEWAEGTRNRLLLTIDDTWDTMFIGIRTNAADNIGAYYPKPELPNGQYVVSLMVDVKNTLTVKGTFSDVQIEIGSTATSYEPYIKHTYPLDSSVTLRGKYVLDNGQLKAVGDVYPSSGQIGRNWSEEVDLGSATWSYNTSLGGIFIATTNTLPTPPKNTFVGVCNKYVYGGAYTALSDKQFGYVYGDALCIKDSAYTDATSFKQHLTDIGAKLVYEVATPTTETATPYTSPQWCDSHGTEEYIGSELPVGHNTDYPMSLVDTMPTTNGTFEPRVTVTNGVRTVTWVSV